MKTLLISLAVLISGAVEAQTEVDFLNAVGKKDFSNIESYLSSNVTFCVDDKQNKLKRSSAVSRLQDFMSTKKVLKFKILHNGKSSDRSSSYRVARMKTEGGTYRIFAYSEVSGSTSKVIEVRIDSM